VRIRTHKLATIWDFLVPVLEFREKSMKAGRALRSDLLTKSARFNAMNRHHPKQ
jgi:hypothetical protein